MILRYTDFGLNFDFEKEQNYLFVIENSNYFYKITRMLFEQSRGKEGDFVLFKGLDFFNISKSIEFFYDFYNIEVNTKKILTELTNQAINILKENDFILDFSIINEKFNAINRKIKEELDFDIDYKYEITYEEFAKISDYKINEENSPLANLETYLDLIKKTKKAKIVVFVNIFDYFSEHDIKLFIKDLNYMEYNILFLESKEKYDVNAKKIIIDQDLCVI